MKKKIIKCILVILWMSVIFYFSSFNSEKSTMQSQGIINKTNIVQIYKEKSNTNYDIALLRIDVFFRKIAHVIEYFILSILVLSLLSEYKISINKVILISFAICLLYAISDEVHQLFIDGRSAEIKDVLIDSIGFISGILIYNRRLK